MPPSDARPMIEIRDLTKSFGSYQALKGVTLDIAPGEFFSLLGPSGCGKSTLLRILAGIEQPSSGALLLDGQNMVGVPANRRPTNMVFQNYAIFPHLSLRENVAYGLAYQRLPAAEIQRRTDDAIAMVKLDGLGNRKAGQLSGGQRQRVALARALVCRPKVLLLDEPLSALDKRLREDMQQELRALQRGLGITFVFVTHDQEEALALSDRVAVMRGGDILQVNAPEHLYARPANREVATFIGTMNFLPGRVVGAADGLVEVESVNGLRLRVAADADLTRQVDLALRPEGLSLSSAAGPNRLSATVEDVAYLGDRHQVRVRVAGLDLALTCMTPARGPAGKSVGDPDILRPGSPVFVELDERSVLLLPAS